MKKTILALILFIPSFVFAQDLATYSIRFTIDGMMLPDVPPGTGNKSLEFTVKFPADNAEAAQILWYKHADACFSDNDRAELRSIVDELGKSRR